MDKGRWQRKKLWVGLIKSVFSSKLWQLISSPLKKFGFDSLDKTFMKSKGQNFQSRQGDQQRIIMKLSLNWTIADQSSSVLSELGYDLNQAFILSVWILPANFIWKKALLKIHTYICTCIYARTLMCIQRWMRKPQVCLSVEQGSSFPEQIASM